MENPNRMRNFALQELRGGKEPRVNEKERPKKSLRLMLPAWLGGRAGKDLDKIRKE
jgi:hypothetical protein